MRDVPGMLAPLAAVGIVDHSAAWIRKPAERQRIPRLKQHKP
jgi:hypothetical protein